MRVDTAEPKPTTVYLFRKSYARACLFISSSSSRSSFTGIENHAKDRFETWKKHLRFLFYADFLWKYANKYINCYQTQIGSFWVIFWKSNNFLKNMDCVLICVSGVETGFTGLNAWKGCERVYNCRPSPGVLTPNSGRVPPLHPSHQAAAPRYPQPTAYAQQPTLWSSSCFHPSPYAWPCWLEFNSWVA